MITCTLGDKKYTVDFITGRALREMEPASKVYSQIVTYSQAVAEGKDTKNMEIPDMNKSLDTLIRWFCLLFHNQFTVDDVLDNYPVDRMVHDIAFALMAVQSQTTEILSDFPTKPVQTKKTETKANPVEIQKKTV